MELHAVVEVLVVVEVPATDEVPLNEVAGEEVVDVPDEEFLVSNEQIPVADEVTLTPLLDDDDTPIIIDATTRAST